MKRVLKKSIENFKLLRYRRFISYLIKNGLKLGNNVTIAPSVWIDCEYPNIISIGNNCTLSKNVKLIAHDAATFKYLGVTRVGKIEIRDNCYIGENTIILPGVTIGPNVLISAGSVVNKDIAPDSCAAGVPARFYTRFSDFLDTNRNQCTTENVFDYSELCLKKDAHIVERFLRCVQQTDVYVKGFEGKFPWDWNHHQ